MALLSNEKLIKYIPELFTTDIKGQIDIFRKLEKILIFEEGFLYFANPDSLQLKYHYKKHSNYKIEQVFNMDKTTRDFVFSKKNAIMLNSDELIELLELISFIILIPFSCSSLFNPK